MISIFLLAFTKGIFTGIACCEMRDFVLKVSLLNLKSTLKMLRKQMCCQGEPIRSPDRTGQWQAATWNHGVTRTVWGQFRALTLTLFVYLSVCFHKWQSVNQCLDFGHCSLIDDPRPKNLMSYTLYDSTIPKWYFYGYISLIPLYDTMPYCFSDCTPSNIAPGGKFGGRFSEKNIKFEKRL